jgi:hypothetical protein
MERKPVFFDLPNGSTLLSIGVRFMGKTDWSTEYQWDVTEQVNRIVELRLAALKGDENAKTDEAGSAGPAADTGASGGDGAAGEAERGREGGGACGEEAGRRLSGDEAE